MTSTSRASVFWHGMVLFLPLVLLSSVSADVLLQSDSRALFGDKPFDYFFIEAEDFHDNDPRGLGAAWILSSEEDALAQTVQEEEDPDKPGFEPDPWAFSSGNESITNTIQTLVTNEIGGDHDVQYLLQFDRPGDYYLYIRQHSPLGPNVDRNKHDSFYTPTEFGEDPLQSKANGDDYGLLEAVGFEDNHFERGPWVWFAAREFVENLESDPLSEQEEDTFNVFTVRSQDVGRELILELDHREAGTMVDALLFIAPDSDLPPTDGAGPDGDGFYGPGDLVDEEFGLMNLGMGILGDYDGDQLLTDADLDLQASEGIAGQDLTYDLNADGVVDFAGDRVMWLHDLKSVYVGDADLNGQFDSSDFVAVFVAGKYETGEAAGWAEGDWDGDQQFGSSDFVAAFIDGGYEAGEFPAAAVKAVPEPSSVVLLLLSFAGLLRMARRRN